MILLDENFDPSFCWIALEEGKAAGFLSAMKRKYPYGERGLEEDKGWIQVIFTDRPAQRHGIGGKMLVKAEKKLREAGAKTIILGAYSPSYFFYGLDPDHYASSVSFFRKYGYTAGETHYSMGMDLRDYQMPDRLLTKKKKAEEKGYRFIPFDYSYCVALPVFMKENFGGGWRRHAMEAMRRGTAEDVIVLALNPEGEIIGCANRATDGNPSRFGPIGIAEGYRDRGLGSVLLGTALEEMRGKGIDDMFFMTTDEDGMRYYLRNGLHVLRSFVSCHKDF
jgi:GNAT superfamily N-acetyltransferase